MNKQTSKVENERVELVEDELEQVNGGASGVPGVSLSGGGVPGYSFKIDGSVSGGGVPGKPVYDFKFKF